MMDLGYEEAEVIVLDIRDKTKEKALNTALNKITGKWDNQLLKDLLVELDLEGYDFSVTGFQRTDLEDLIQLTEVPPEAQEQAILAYLSEAGFAYRQDIARVLRIGPRQCWPILQRMLAEHQIAKDGQKYILLQKEA